MGTIETKLLIEKIETSREYYVIFGKQCITELSKRYKTERHPDCRSLIIKDVGFDILKEICAKYGCSGHVGVNSIVVTNFGYYKQYEKKY